MKLKHSDSKWEEDAPTLAAIKRVNPFVVPSGYFESLTDQLNSKALIESARFESEEEFNTPADYFQKLPSRIEEKIAIEAIQSLVPSTGFTVPEAYFSDLGERIQTKLAEQKPERKKNFFKSWISYSAAACITLVLGTAVYFNSSGYTINRDLSEVPDQEIINYLQIHSTVNDNQFIIENLSEDGLQQITSDVSSQDIEQYINNTTL
jgi:hypothetical protein